MARYIKSGTVTGIPALNAELEKIENSFKEMLSRTGESPNQMTADLDMNGNSILNVVTDPNNDASLVARGNVYLKGEVDAKDAATLESAQDYADNLSYQIAQPTFVTPEMFGAKGDGVTDDTSAIQTALDHPSRKVAFKATTYRHTELKPSSDLVLVGVPGVTKLKVTDSAPSNNNCMALALDGSDGSLDNFYALGIIFDSNNKESGFLVNGATNLFFDKCEFSNNETYGFAAQVRPGEPNYAVKDNITFLDCKFNNNGSSPTTYDGVDIKYGTNIKFINCEARDNSHTGFGCRGEVQYVNCRTSGNGIIGFHAQADNSAAGNPTIISFESCVSDGDAEGFRLSGANLNECVITGDIKAFNSTGSGLSINAPDGGGTNRVRGSVDVLTTGCANGVTIADNAVTSLHISGISYGNSNHGLENDGQNVVIDMVIKNNGANGYRELANSSNNILLPSTVVSGNASGNIPTRVGSVTDGTGFAYETETKVRTMPHLSGAPYFERVSNTLARVGADGSSSNIDLDLAPKGTGLVRLGGHTTTADTSITGYIQVKDDTGAIRKLAVIA